jgi:hypothetical protein
MKLRFSLQRLVVVSVVALFFAASKSVQAQTPPKMKMTTDIPPSITTPDSVDTPIGTFKFFDGFPDDRTTQLVYDNLDFMRGVPGSSCFRLYGPLEPWFDKTCRVGEVELVK